MLKIFRIRGDSLFPLFKNNELVIATKFFSLKLRDIVVFQEKKHGLMIKQIQNIKNDTFFLTGTLPSSIDSRNFGYIPKKDIKYKVLFKIL